MERQSYSNERKAISIRQLERKIPKLDATKK